MWEFIISVATSLRYSKMYSIISFITPINLIWFYLYPFFYPICLILSIVSSITLQYNLSYHYFYRSHVTLQQNVLQILFILFVLFCPYYLPSHYSRNYHIITSIAVSPRYNRLYYNLFYICIILSALSSITLQ